MYAEDQYWAVLPGPELAEAINEKVEQFDRYLLESGLLSLYQRSARTYWKAVEQSSLVETGEQGEYTTLFVNHTRNIMRHIYVTTTGTRPDFEVRAINVDFKSRAQVQACRGLLDYYYDEKKVEFRIDRAVESTLAFGEGFASYRWDENAGDIAAIDQSQMDEMGNALPRPVYEGDIRIRNHSPVDVIRDTSAENFDDMPWVILREPHNRWDLIAQFPAAREDILQAESRSTRRRSYDTRLSPLYPRDWDSYESDDVDVLVFYHERTPAVPLGRMTLVLGEDTVLLDQTMEQAGLKCRPLARLSGGDIEGSPFGYSFAFDLLALQELCNILYSIVATNQNNFGVQSVQSMKGSGITVTQIAKGLMHIEYSNPQGKLEPLQLTATPAEVFKFLEMVEHTMEIISGVNSVARGDPPAALKSGAALAIVQSQHIEFTKDLQAGTGGFTGDVCTGMVRLFKAHATHPRLAAIVGKGGRQYLKALSGEDLSMVDRVSVSMGSHLSRTPAGRLNLAEQLIKAGLVKSPEQFMGVLETGRLEPVTHGPQGQLDLIQAENEEILEGRNPAILVTDDHPLHILEHATVAADTEVRRESAVMMALTEHINAHIQALETMPPVLAALLKLPQLGIGAQGGPDQNQGTPAASGAETSVDNPASGTTGSVDFPQNPQTGEQWDPVSGGLPQ